jgi:hypothetical protein
MHDINMLNIALHALLLRCVRRKWQVTGVDSWKGAVERTLTLAARWRVTDRVTVLQGKVRISHLKSTQ